MQNSHTLNWSYFEISIMNEIFNFAEFIRKYLSRIIALQWVQNSIFPDGKLISPVFFIDKYLKFKEIVYLIHEVKFEMHQTYFM